MGICDREGDQSEIWSPGTPLAGLFLLGWFATCCAAAASVSRLAQYRHYASSDKPRPPSVRYLAGPDRNEEYSRSVICQLVPTTDSRVTYKNYIEPETVVIFH